MLGQMIAPALGSFTETPLGRAAMRYWWVTVPVGYLAYTFYKERQKKDEATVGNLVRDMTPVVSLIGILVSLNFAMERIEAQRQANATAAPPKPAPLPAVDAEFTPMPRS